MLGSTFMEFVKICIVYLVLYLSLYALLDRAFSCIEHCAEAKALMKKMELEEKINKKAEELS